MDPKFITVHCSATKPKNSFGVDRLRELHVNQNGWSDIGYHFYITVDGKINPCRPLSRNGAHVRGHNTDNVGICLEGGLNNDTGNPDDTFNHEQRSTLKMLIGELQDKYAIANTDIKGHRDWYGPNRSDWKKDCPCFSVSKFIGD